MNETILFWKVMAVCLGLFFLFFVIVWIFSPRPTGFHSSAKWRVRYNDGGVSTPCEKQTAKDYAEIFGGKVERVPK